MENFSFFIDDTVSYCFKLEHILPQDALNYYYKLFPDEVFLSNIYLELCPASLPPAVMSFQDDFLLHLASEVIAFHSFALIHYADKCNKCIIMYIDKYYEEKNWGLIESNEKDLSFKILEFRGDSRGSNL